MSLGHKFKAKPVVDDGIRFASKKEYKRYTELKLLQKYGEIACFTMQAPWWLEGGVKYVCDFLIFWKDGTVTIEDVKGYKTREYLNKKKQVEARYPFTITEI